MSQTPRNSNLRPSRGTQRIRSGNRTLMACVNCKEKKLKCDNNPSRCENCRRCDFTCLVEDPATKRHVPRNYLEILEQRVAFLEGVLQQYRPDLSSDHLLQYNPLQPEPQPEPSVMTRSVDDQDRGSSHEESDARDGLDALASKVGLLSLNAAGAEPHYLGSSSIFAFSRLINSSLRQVASTNPNNGNKFGQIENGSSMLPAPCLLPDYDTAIKLSDAYFQNIHTQYPFLHKPTFKIWEATVMSGSAELENIAPDPLPFFFLNMVYAIGALLLPNCGYSAERLYISAQMYIDHILPRDNFEAIQAILCCALYSLRSSIGTSHWKLAGLALRQCIDLGYHRSTKHLRSTADPLRLELRKRVFWCAYLIESQAAIMLGRPQGIPYQEVDAEYPMDIDDSKITDNGIYGTPRDSMRDPPTNMTRAVHTFRIRHLLNHVHGSLYSNMEPCCSAKHEPCCSAKHIHNNHVQHLRADIENWRTGIPSMTSCNGEALTLFGTSEWFDLEYYYAILQLYRIQIIDSKAETPDSVFLDCLRAAENICHGYRRQFLGKQTSYTWTALHELFLAGLTYLHCLWTSPTAREVHRQGQVSSTCTDCTIVLVIIAERWKAAAPFRDIFETLANRTMTMMDEKVNAKRTVPAASEEPAEDLDQGDLMQWMMLMADTGMPESFNGLLTGLVDDCSPHEWNHPM